MGWSKSQHKQFAKEVIATEFDRGASLSYLTSAMRKALVAARCLSIAVMQDKDTVRVDDLRDLVSGVEEEICRKFGEGFFQ